MGSVVAVIYLDHMMMEIRQFLASFALGVCSVCMLLFPGGMVAFGEEDGDGLHTEEPLFSSALEVRQIFQLGKVTKLVYHIRSYTGDGQGIDHAISYVPQGKWGKKCIYGYKFYELDVGRSLMSGFFVTCKKAKDIYIVYSIFCNPGKLVEVQMEEFKVIDNAVYSKTEGSLGGDAYSTPWYLYAISQDEIDDMIRSIASFEKNEEDKKRMISFSKWIARAFMDSGEKGVMNAIKKSKKYTFSAASKH